MTQAAGRLRTAEIVTFCGYVAFVIAGLALYWLVDDSPFIPLMNRHVEFAISWDVIAGASALSVAAVAAGGLPIGWAVVRRVWRRDRRDMWLLVVPVLALAVVAAPVALTLAVVVFDPSAMQNPPAGPAGVPFAVAYGALAIMALLGGTAAVCAAVARTSEEEITFRARGISLTVQPYEFGVLPATAAVLTMLLMLAGTVAWGLIARAYAPADFASIAAGWAAILVVMSASTLAAGTATVRGWRARAAR